MGELMDVLDPALSSASRPKTHYRGKPLKSGAKPEARTEAGVRPHNEVLFLESAEIRTDGAGDASGLESASFWNPLSTCPMNNLG